jgi:hypothetical protein
MFTMLLLVSLEPNVLDTPLPPSWGILATPNAEFLRLPTRECGFGSALAGGPTGTTHEHWQLACVDDFLVEPRRLTASPPAPATWFLIGRQETWTGCSLKGTAAR